MALFRMLCVHFQRYIPPLEKLMVRLLWLQYALILAICISCVSAVKTYGSSNTHEFCRGYTTKMAHVVMKQTEDEKDFGKDHLHATILFAQSFNILEFICYVVVYWKLLEQNKSFLNILQKDVLEKRAKKNTITLTGQAITFSVEITYSVLMQVLMHFGTLGGYFEPGALPCFGVVAMGAITASQVLVSPELRRFVQGLD